jgi:aquaporin Z
MVEQQRAESTTQIEQGIGREVVNEVENEVTTRVIDFQDPRQEWRRVVSEPVGTFVLVLAAAGAGMMGAAFDNCIGRVAAVVAPDTA